MLNSLCKDNKTSKKEQDKVEHEESTSKCNFTRFRALKFNFPGASVQLILDVLDKGAGEEAEVGAFGEVLPDELVGLLDGALLPEGLSRRGIG